LLLLLVEGFLSTDLIFWAEAEKDEELRSVVVDLACGGGGNGSDNADALIVEVSDDDDDGADEVVVVVVLGAVED
jgi:hypothetical protein